MSGTVQISHHHTHLLVLVGAVAVGLVLLAAGLVVVGWLAALDILANLLAARPLLVLVVKHACDRGQEQRGGPGRK